MWLITGKLQWMTSPLDGQWTRRWDWCKLSNIRTSMEKFVRLIGLPAATPSSRIPKRRSSTSKTMVARNKIRKRFSHTFFNPTYMLCISILFSFYLLNPIQRFLSCLFKVWNKQQKDLGWSWIFRSFGVWWQSIFKLGLRWNLHDKM